MTPIYPDIPPFTPKDRSPAKLSVVQHWGFFSREEIAREAGRLLMLDIDFGRDCSLRCPTCFRRRNSVDDSADPDLTYDELLEMLRQARELGSRQSRSAAPASRSRILTCFAWPVR